MLVPTVGVGPVTTFRGRVTSLGGEVETAAGTTVEKEHVGAAMGAAMAGGEVGREEWPVGVGVCPTLSTPESLFSFFGGAPFLGIELLIFAGGLNDRREPNEGLIPVFSIEFGFRIIHF